MADENVVFASTELYDLRVNEDGSRVRATIRVSGAGKTASEAIDDLYAGIAHAGSEYGATPYVDVYSTPVGKAANSAPAQPGLQEPVRMDVDEHGNESGQIVEHPIEQVAYQVTENGNPYIAVFGGWFRKFGLKAWPEMIPADVAQSYLTWDKGVKKTPPDNMKTALVRDRKFVGFKV